ncbi:AmmeMemoRadiSam system radical SAM enzyme [Patescibacteria group bacterium]|nr:AmmeMemoRadiSam system radical SAM enzyme [Patescibacteria group bacterium]MCG2702221.1 AmmeMemoRadiSam system radical SAM enzyme [Candidatus Parcubacteria bacterium]MBU4264765.1 AmmeMemoRadiSam system radical SAM enzyme [Patescibacteria group bacterium]MBU4390103.1 AmmeMemoRadiSam system radical SAM enzyme [Patescibacteria group bacterium]MBU4397549.1 AmmeMemoRadiSam system radical SAM enzyme [Patescibacteria group bacterium]
MKKAKTLYKKLDKNTVQCRACNWYCKIKEGNVGICGVRQNNSGELCLLVDGKIISLAVDPIEKKPLFHFLPASKTLSFGTLGCNFGCAFCQNWQQSQGIKGKLWLLLNYSEVRRSLDFARDDKTPKEIVEKAEKLGCESIAYTYNEPTIFVEYAYETMKLAKKAGIKNVWVSNGFMSDESFELIKDLIDGINIDLKSINSDFYRKICKGKLEPVLKNIKKFYKAGIWIELTTMIIAGENDSPAELKKIAEFIANLSCDIPWHVTAFHPDYKMMDKEATSLEKLEEAWQIGKKSGLKYIYTGNVWGGKNSTYCVECGNLLIDRGDYGSGKVLGLADGKCEECGQKISGAW